MSGQKSMWLFIRSLRRPLFAALLWLGASSAWAELSDEKAVEYLMGVDFADLNTIEVSLDDVFDIFDGLIKREAVKVATGVKQTSSKSPSATSIITAQDIEAMGARDLNEVLEAVPGLHVMRNGYAYAPVFSVRGIQSTGFNPEILFLINGVPITIAATGGFGDKNWGGMPLQQVARIEVIRGPGSAVYGADAFSGVINIITKKRQDIKNTEAGIRAGSFDSWDMWLLHGGHIADFDFSLGMELGGTGGHTEILREDAQSQLDRLFGTAASHAPGAVNLSRRNTDIRADISRDKWRLRAAYQDRSNLGTGAGMAQALDNQGRTASKRFNTDLTWHDPSLNRYWDVTAQLSYYRFTQRIEKDWQLFPPGAFGGVYPDGFIGSPGYAERGVRANLFGFYSGFEQHLLRVGTEFLHSDLYEVTERKNFGPDPVSALPIPPGSPPIDVSDSPAAYIPELDRANQSLYLQDIWTISGNWELTAGVRYDKYSDFGSTLNPRAALVWQETPSLTGKLLYGKAFRAPSFVELHIQNNPVIQGNPDLKPETVATWELAFDFMAAKNLHFGLNLFSYKLKDKIVSAPNPYPNLDDDAPPLLYQNAGGQNGHGFEFETRWKPTLTTSLLFNYALQRSKNTLVNKDTHDAPRQQAYLRADWLFTPNWFLDTRINRVTGRKRRFDDPRQPIAGYTTVDLSVRYKPGNRPWSFAAGIYNLFDRDIYEPSEGPDSSGIVNIPYDLPLAGRNFFAELRYRLN